VPAARVSVVAVDLGASSGKVLLADAGTRELVLHEVTRFPNGPVEQQGSWRWDMAHLRRSVATGVARALSQAVAEDAPVSSIGICTWGVDYGLVTDGGALLEEPFSYRDGRTAGLPGVVQQTVSPLELYGRTGTSPLALQTIYQLVAARRGPHLAQAARALLMPDLLNFWLTGHARCEITNASTTGLVDPARRGFDADLLRLLQLPAGLFAPLIEPGTDVGPVVAGRDEQVIPLAGTRVVAVASHDTASAVVAVPATQERFAFLSCGTWSVLGVERATPVLTAESLAAGFGNELGVDGTVRLVRNMSGLWLLQECMRTWEERGVGIAIDDLVAQAASAPSLRTVVDPDDPLFGAPGDLSARIADAARRLGQPEPRTPGEVARCVFDSLALAHRRHLRAVVDLTGDDIEVLHMVGGGSRNALLCQLTADACGRRVVAGPTEASGIGNALIQLRPLLLPGAGLGDLRKLSATVAPLLVYEPSGSDAPWAAAARLT
jgi:rhamnulokinase